MIVISHIYIWNVIRIRNMVDYSIDKKWDNEKAKDNEGEQREFIIATVKLVPEIIRVSKPDCKFYPPKKTMAYVKKDLQWTPHI